MQLFPPHCLPLLHILFPFFSCTLYFFTSHSALSTYVLGNTLTKVKSDLLFTKIHGLQNHPRLFDLPVKVEAVGHFFLLESLFSGLLELPPPAFLIFSFPSSLSSPKLKMWTSSQFCVLGLSLVSRQVLLVTQSTLILSLSLSLSFSSSGKVTLQGVNHD